MQERLSRKDAEEEGNRIRKIASRLNLSRPTSKEYEDIDVALSKADEIKAKLENVIKTVSSMPEVEEAFRLAENNDEAGKQIRTLIFSKFREGTLPELADLWKAEDPNIVDDILVGEVLLRLFHKLEIDIKSMTSYNAKLERVFEHEFNPTEIIDEICKNEGIKPQDLGITEIIKDKNGKVVTMFFALDESISIDMFGKLAEYGLYYPQKEKGEDVEVFPLVPTILRTLEGPEAETFYKENSDKIKSLDPDSLIKLGEHRRLEAVARFVDGYWHWEKDL